MGRPKTRNSYVSWYIINSIKAQCSPLYTFMSYIYRHRPQAQLSTSLLYEALNHYPVAEDTVDLIEEAFLASDLDILEEAG